MKRKFKLIAPSLAVIVVCLLLMLGSTFAIFTSQASADISVTSGKVKVAASLNGLEAYSAQPNDAIATTADGYAGKATAFGVESKYEYILRETAITNGFTFANGGGVTLVSNELSLVKVTPGDKAVVTLNLINSSNVNIKYRVRYNAMTDDGLLSGLKVKVLTPQNTNPVTYSEEVLNGVIKVGKWADWNAPATETETKTLKLVVELPITAGNEYQSKNASLRFTVEAVQGNAKVDTLLEEVNEHLTESTHDTMYDAKLDAEVFRSAFDATKYLWNIDTDQFYDPTNVVAGFEDRYFKAYTQQQFNEESEHKYNVYATDAWTGISSINPLDITTGFDAGSSTGISDIAYTGSTTQGKEVIIRTNGGSLTINAPLDVVHHYGNVDTLNIIAVANQSYHENGYVALVEIKNGRIVLEETSEVGQVHLAVTGTGSAAYFDDITVAKATNVEMPKFSRDPVEIPTEGKLVVALQDSTQEEAEKDYVWLTAVGIYEQVTVSDSDTNAGTTFAATSGDAEQKQAAQQIANNIGFSVSNEEYKVTATPVIVDNVVTSWNYEVKTVSGESASASYTAEKSTTQNTVDVKTNEETPVAVETQTKNGLIESEKEEIIAAFESGVARIGNTRYDTLQAAVDAASNNDTIVILKDITLGNEYLLVNKTVELDLNGKSLTGSHDPMIVIGASVGKYQPTSSQLTHTGHLTIRGEGSITSNNWDMICIFPDATLDIYGGNYTGFKATFYIYGGTLNTYAGNFTVTSPNGTYIVQVKGGGTANIYAGNFTTPLNGGYGVYLDNASVSNFGSTNGEGPIFNTWRACIASNGSESHAVLANIYSGTYHSYRSDNATGENSVIQLANATSETQTLNVYGGTFEQTGSNENRCIFNVRYSGTINVNISGGTFVATSASRLFNGVGSDKSGWPSSENVHITVANNAITTPQNVKVYNTSDVYQSEKDFELTIQ